MVRALVPRAIPGRSTDDIVTARADYSRLDEPASPARVRLNSTVVRVAHRGKANDARAADVTYVAGRPAALACGARARGDRLLAHHDPVPLPGAARGRRRRRWPTR